MQSIVGKYQFNNQEMQKKISAIIEKDTTLKEEITQLRNSECDCENENTIEWRFPFLCLLLFPIALCVLMISGLFFGGLFGGILWGIGLLLQCFWSNPWIR
jgi:hypothetical protein